MSNDAADMPTDATPPSEPLSLGDDKPQRSDTVPLSLAQQREIQLARRRVEKVAGAMKMANFNGYATLFFAICSLPFALNDVAGFLVAVALWGVALVELGHRPHIQRMDPVGLRRLGWNQVTFMALLVIYSVFNIILVETGNSGIGDELQSELGGYDLSGVDVDGLVRASTLAIYGTLIIVSVLFQGLWFARSYFKNARLAQEFHDETPEWVVDIVTPEK
ncbi:MAG: hypothetical protein GC159_14155 [Phycisphaera sp.]|nr:hypothetical protein [Phycisphaera sp.]